MIILKIVCLLSFNLGRLSGFDSLWMQNRHKPLTVSTSHSHHVKFPNHQVYPSNQLYWYWYYNYMKGLAKNGNEGETTKYAQVGDQIIECDKCQTCEGCYGYCPEQVKTADGTKTVRNHGVDKWNDGSPWDHTITWGGDSTTVFRPGYRHLVYSYGSDGYARKPIDRPQLFVCRIYCHSS